MRKGGAPHQLDSKRRFWFCVLSWSRKEFGPVMNDEVSLCYRQPGATRLVLVHKTGWAMWESLGRSEKRSNECCIGYHLTQLFRFFVCSVCWFLLLHNGGKLCVCMDVGGINLWSVGFSVLFLWFLFVLLLHGVILHSHSRPNHAIRYLDDYASAPVSAARTQHSYSNTTHPPLVTGPNFQVASSLSLQQFTVVVLCVFVCVVVTAESKDKSSETDIHPLIR